MRIAIHAADLDHARIDGTRVYLLNVLKKLGELGAEDEFLIYHKGKFNPQLRPPQKDNYVFKSLGKFPAWTQTRLALELWRDKPDALWVPLHNLPRLRRQEMRTVVTIHDLAFKIFPQHFTAKDLFKLESLTDYAVKNADAIIAPSEATKRDILAFYPRLPKNKVRVVLHGFDPDLFQQDISKEKLAGILSAFDLHLGPYVLYVGAIQPRKNLNVLVEAFEEVKKEKNDLKLVLAGAPAWKARETLARIERSEFCKDIVVTGTVPFAELAALYRGAAAFVFPSLYEGFGIPLLEAFASRTVAVCADNSSLREVGADAALYFAATDAGELKEKLNKVLSDDNLRAQLIAKGEERIKEFSWKKCAAGTLEAIRQAAQDV